ncbi:hypothetical protein AAV35_012315 [Salimicrobium jeotgali]|uniref:Uncharacterized protein n=1 Tax=Salimicrobium jeotgali TaxID=1230341 RepID=A0AAC8PV88_9BACI|nr:hypothetical protein AAV35_012315 [Salimicrobium jeotgali]
MNVWTLQLDHEKRTHPVRSSGLSRRFAFQVSFPEKETTAWTVDFWVVQLDTMKSGNFRVKFPDRGRLDIQAEKSVPPFIRQGVLFL